MTTDRHEVFENEWLAVRDSGELPEIAYHSSIFYLTKDESGPHLVLSEKERHLLLEAAKRRYQDIILRDMLPENRGKPYYRGLKRSMENWQRVLLFEKRHGIEIASLQRAAAVALHSFLATEVEEGVFPSPSVNCTLQELLSFAEELGLSRQELPDNVERYFQPRGG